MISSIYKKLFAYGDKLAKEGRNDERRVVHQCESLVHDAYMECLYSSKEVENQVSSLDGLKAYKDIQDGETYYELDNRHFDSIEEVVIYLIDFHNHAVQYNKGRSLEQARKQRSSSNELTIGNREFNNKPERPYT